MILGKRLRSNRAGSFQIQASAFPKVSARHGGTPWNPSTWEVGRGESEVPGSSVGYVRSCLQNKKVPGRVWCEEGSEDPLSEDHHFTSSYKSDGGLYLMQNLSWLPGHENKDQPSRLMPTYWKLDPERLRHMLVIPSTGTNKQAKL